MKVLSLLQPWATLVVIGAKKIETRSWSTRYHGDLLIHASKKMAPIQQQLCKFEPFKTALQCFDELPLGAIIGKVTMCASVKTESLPKIHHQELELVDGPYATSKWILTKDEVAFGDYSPGRYAWLFKEPVQFSNQLKCNGSLSIWDLDQRICIGCGCTDHDCRKCIEKTGYPCHWVEARLCSACVNADTK